MDLRKILDTKPVPTIVDSQTLGVSGNISGDYWLPTTMCLYQKELTEQIVSLHYSDILGYFETTTYKEDVVLESMRTMCLNSEYVSTHPYLLIDHYMPKSLITRDIPAQLAETSGKFTALRDLMNLVQKYETNTAIICRPGRTMDLVEALLLGNKINIKRYDGHSIKSKQKKPKTYSCTCHLFPSSDYQASKYSITEPHQFDMVICVDPTVDTTVNFIQKIICHVRNQRGDTPRAPIVRLTTINSIDHCDLFFGKQYDKKSTKFLERVTAAVVVLRDRVGTLPPDLRPIYSQHLSYLVQWLEAPSIPWPLPDVYPIKEYNSMDVERSLLSEVKFNQIENLDDLFESNSRKRGRSKNEKSDSHNEDSIEIKSYYSLKRLKNEYSTNPTKQDMSQLTGITTGGGDSDNYHLSSGILTHKLIQFIGQVYIDIERQVSELKDYNDLNEIEDDHVTFYSNERSDMKRKHQEYIDIIEKLSKDSKDLEELNNLTYEEVQKSEETYNKSLEDLKCKGELDAKLKNLLLEKNELDDKLAQQDRQKQSKFAEKEYMEKEITRADDAIKSTSDDLNKLNIESESLQIQIKEIFENDKLKLDAVMERINNIKLQTKDEESQYEELENKLSDLIEKLHKVPIPRVRTSYNGKSKSKSKRK